MEKISRLWDFRGRAGRGEYWAYSIVLNVISRVMAALFGDNPVSPALGLIPLVVVLALLPIHAAVAVRRLHDRGRTGWWAVLFIGAVIIAGGATAFVGQMSSWSPLVIVGALILLAILVWMFVELAVLPGKVGANRYVNLSESEAAAFD